MKLIYRSHEKMVIYEIMDKDEISYFRDNHKNSSNFISIDYQIKRGINEGYF